MEKNNGGITETSVTDTREGKNVEWQHAGAGHTGNGDEKFSPRSAAYVTGPPSHVIRITMNGTRVREDGPLSMLENCKCGRGWFVSSVPEGLPEKILVVNAMQILFDAS